MKVTKINIAKLILVGLLLVAAILNVINYYGPKLKSLQYSAYAMAGIIAVLYLAVVIIQFMTERKRGSAKKQIASTDALMANKQQVGGNVQDVFTTTTNAETNGDSISFNELGQNNAEGAPSRNEAKIKPKK